MMNAAEVKSWLATVDDSSSVAIGEGGLCLVELTSAGEKTHAYLEIGGIPSEPEGDGEMRNYAIVGNAVYASGFDVVVRAVYEGGSIVSYRRIGWAHAWVKWFCRKFASND
jgi:hypothetical protein